MQLEEGPKLALHKERTRKRKDFKNNRKINYYNTLGQECDMNSSNEDKLQQLPLRFVHKKNNDDNNETKYMPTDS